MDYKDITGTMEPLRGLTGAGSGGAAQSPTPPTTAFSQPARQLQCFAACLSTLASEDAVST